MTRARRPLPTKEELGFALQFTEWDLNSAPDVENQARLTVEWLGTGATEESAAELIAQMHGFYGKAHHTALRHALSSPEGGKPTNVQKVAGEALRPLLERGKGKKFYADKARKQPYATMVRAHLYRRVYDLLTDRGYDRRHVIEFIDLYYYRGKYGASGDDFSRREAIRKALDRTIPKPLTTEEIAEREGF